jgi:hypothetical protein
MPMSEEYKLLAHFPFADPETEAVTRIAAVLGVEVSTGPEGAPEATTDGFLVYGFLPDEVDRKAVDDLFGLDTNLTLVFTDLVDNGEPVDQESVDSGAVVAPALAPSMLKVAASLATVDGAHGVIVSDYTADAILLAFEDGQVTLNQNWGGWQARPELLEAIPEPRTMESLMGRN